ncbi:MAG TPA: hypothetical protein VK557_10315 [Pyrinomonadaceae bacterium]|nr:hypothetical protein [Pyrinomonadaceae bacterium]
MLDRHCLRNHPLIQELPPDELGGASGARAFYVYTVGKRNTPEYPYSVANEKVASELGRVIGLRIPEVLLYRDTGEWLAFSHFIARTESGETVPEGTAAEIAGFFERNPLELHGMICFDLFVCNNDRKTDNLLVGDDQKVWLIDHANSLFYRPAGEIRPGIARLTSVENDLKAMFDKPHRFIGALNSWEHIDTWCERFSQIPSYFIQSIIENLPEGILTETERAFLFEFLERRKNRMGAIIQENQRLFPALRHRGGEEDE